MEDGSDSICKRTFWTSNPIRARCKEEQELVAVSIKQRERERSGILEILLPTIAKDIVVVHSKRSESRVSVSQNLHLSSSDSWIFRRRKNKGDAASPILAPPAPSTVTPSANKNKKNAIFTIKFFFYEFDGDYF